MQQTDLDREIAEIQKRLDGPEPPGLDEVASIIAYACRGFRELTGDQPEKKEPDMKLDDILAALPPEVRDMVIAALKEESAEWGSRIKAAPQCGEHLGL